MTLAPHRIVDKNGRLTTVYRRDQQPTKTLPAASRAKPIHLKPGIFPPEVLSNGEVRTFSDESPEFALKLSEVTGWDVVANVVSAPNIASEDGFVNPGAEWHWMGVRTPDGMLIDAEGIHENSNLFNASGSHLGGFEYQLLKVNPEDIDALNEGALRYEHSQDVDISVSKVHEYIFGVPLIDWERNIDEAEKVMFNGKEFAIELDDDSVSPMACAECGTFHPKGADVKARQNRVYCHKCGAIADFDEETFALNRESAKLADPDVVREMTWYHATAREDWDGDLKKTPKPLVIHLGTKEAALERAGHIREDYEDAAMPMYLYEVKLVPNCAVSEDLHSDSDATQPYTVVAMNDIEGMVGDGANRYLNRYENSGSISLMTSRESFSIVSVNEIEPSDTSGWHRQ